MDGAERSYAIEHNPTAQSPPGCMRFPAYLVRQYTQTLQDVEPSKNSCAAV